MFCNEIPFISVTLCVWYRECRNYVVIAVRVLLGGQSILKTIRASVVHLHTRIHVLRYEGSHCEVLRLLAVHCARYEDMTEKRDI